MNNNQLIALALQNDFDAELAMYDGMPEHRFSLRFRRRMRKLLCGFGFALFEVAFRFR